jgi:RNA polymerase sigma-70 factor (ECF subfamily)
VTDRGGSDASLIAASLREPELFGAIFDRHFPAVHGYLSRRVGRGPADDLAASTFTTAFERRRSFRAQADSARPWLFGIATNLLRNQWRAEERALAAVGRLQWAVATSPRAGWPGEGPGDPGLLGAALAELDSDQRDVLLLHAWEGFSYEEIAEALGIPVGTVRSRLSRGRERLRAALQAQSDGGSANG